jgi:DNA-binding LacI/PurR family transcriptional regulator
MRYGSLKKKQPSIGLKALAEHLGLSQGTVSMALSPEAKSTGVAAKTRERVLKAAEELNYRPNYHARSLSRGRSYTVGVMVPAISDGYYSTVIAGIEQYLIEKGYFFFVTSHRWNQERVESLPVALANRGVEGIILVNTTLDQELQLPSVRIGGPKLYPNSTNVRLNEEIGTRLALEHLVSQGHREIAFFRGEPESTATEERWEGIREAARGLRIKVEPSRTVQLNLDGLQASAGDSWVGYSAAQELLRRKVSFTALLAYNDSTAIGAMRAFRDAKIKVPEDVSVIGYDDIPAAQYERPALTTVHQPLQQIGAESAEILLARIAGKRVKSEILIEPTLIVRSSVARVRGT